MAGKNEYVLSSSGYQSAENSDEAEESIIVTGIKPGSRPSCLQTGNFLIFIFISFYFHGEGEIAYNANTCM